jgi:4-diphosphocytidyl-2-C-methyl-D-erythritol kinase
MRRPAPAKINLALIVGPRREDGRHEVTTLYQRVDLCDRIALEPGAELSVTGFRADTLVREALSGLARAAGCDPRWTVEIEKRIPVAAGLGGGSSDAATALLLANATLALALPSSELHELGASLGSDVPFFLEPGPQLGEGDGSRLSRVDLPQDYWVVIVLPKGAEKPSTASVYEAFDRRGGDEGYDERRRAFLDALQRVRRAVDLAGLPLNDLTSSPLARELEELGAFRADVTGAGPAVYGLFLHERPARAAARALRRLGRTWISAPAWYG